MVKDYIIPKDYINNSLLETDTDVDIFDEGKLIKKGVDIVQEHVDSFKTY